MFSFWDETLFLLQKKKGSMIKTLVFDLGGVYFTEGIRKTAEKWANEFRVNKDDVIRELRDSAESNALRTGALNLHGFFDKLREEIGMRQTDDKLTKDWFGSYEVNEGMPELIGELSQAGLELLYLSNTVPERDGYLDEKFGFMRHFAGGLLSYKVGLMKPDEKFYEKIHELTRSRGGEIVFVDDKEKNLEPAIKLGWHAIKFESAEKLRGELRKLGVEI